MSKTFDDLLRGCAPEMPDPSEYRRLNRMAMKARMAYKPARRKRRHTLLVVTCCLLAMVLFSGRVDNLGSYDGSLSSEKTTDILGNDYTVYSQEFGGIEFNTPEDFEESDVRHFHEAIVAGDYEVLDIRCTTVAGKSNWSKTVLMNMEGEKQESSRWVDDFPSDPFEGQLQAFFMLHMGEVTATIKSRPPDETGTLKADGYVFAMKYWYFFFPGFGEVRHARGAPIGRY